VPVVNNPLVARPPLVLPLAPARPSVLLTLVPLVLQPVRPSVLLVLRPPSTDPSLPTTMDTVPATKPTQPEKIPLTLLPQDPPPATAEQPMPVLATLPPPERPVLLAPSKAGDDLNSLIEKMQAAPRLEAKFNTRTDSDTPVVRRKVRPSDLLGAPALPSGSPPVSETKAPEVLETEETPLSTILRLPPSSPPMPDPVYGSE
jgi:hypothetical protein